MASPNSPLEPTLSREYYFSPEIFAQEKARIFFGQWMCVAREEEVPNPGDYLLLDTLGESIILVRTREGNWPRTTTSAVTGDRSWCWAWIQSPGAGPTSGRLSPRRPLIQHLHQWNQVPLPLLDLRADRGSPDRAIPR